MRRGPQPHWRPTFYSPSSRCGTYPLRHPADVRPLRFAVQLLRGSFNDTDKASVVANRRRPSRTECVDDGGMVSAAKIRSVQERHEIRTRTADAVLLPNQNGERISQLRFRIRSSRAL